MSKKQTPDRLYIRKRYEAEFDELRDKLSVDAKNVFLMAMALGFLHEDKERLDSKKEVVLAQVIKEEEPLMATIAVYDVENLNVVLDKATIYSIAEEYASGGLKYLKDDVLRETFGSYIKRLEDQLVTHYKKLKIID